MLTFSDLSILENYFKYVKFSLCFGVSCGICCKYMLCYCFILRPSSNIKMCLSIIFPFLKKSMKTAKNTSLTLSPVSRYLALKRIREVKSSQQSNFNRRGVVQCAILSSKKLTTTMIKNQSSLIKSVIIYTVFHKTNLKEWSMSQMKDWKLIFRSFYQQFVGC